MAHSLRHLYCVAKDRAKEKSPVDYEHLGTAANLNKKNNRRMDSVNIYALQRRLFVTANTVLIVIKCDKNHHQDAEEMATHLLQSTECDPSSGMALWVSGFAELIASAGHCLLLHFPIQKGVQNPWLWGARLASILVLRRLHVAVGEGVGPFASCEAWNKWRI